MSIRKLMAGTALAMGVGVAGMIGAGTADAAPGFSYDPGKGDPIKFGDTSVTGATADASDGNTALAISLFKPASATATGTGTGNRAVAVDGTAVISGGSNNSVTAVGGTAKVGKGSDNSIVALGSNVDAKDEKQQTVFAVCGTSIVSAQSKEVKVSPGACGSTT